MLTEFSIGNYQAFSAPQRVPLKPITLIFGPNSAGKSALLRSLLLVRQAILDESLAKNTNSHELHPGKPGVFVREKHQPLWISFTTHRDGGDEEQGSESHQVDLLWKANEDANVETLSMKVSLNEEEVFRLGRTHETTTLTAEFIHARLISEARGAETKTERQKPHEWLQDRTRVTSTAALPGSRYADFVEPLMIGDDWRHEEAFSNQRNCLWREIQSIVGSVRESLETDLKNMTYHEPVRPVPMRIGKADIDKPMLCEWLKLAYDPDALMRVNRWFASNPHTKRHSLIFDYLLPGSRLADLIEEIGGEVTPDEAVAKAFEARLRADPDFTNKLVEDHVHVYWDDDNPDKCAFDSKEEAMEASYWDILGGSLESGWAQFDELYDSRGRNSALEFLLAGVSALKKNAATNHKVPFEHVEQADIYFVDVATKTKIPPSNLGVGFSQMLPMVVSAFTCEKQLIVIEQPELHVHPALQTELADLFIQSAKERGNRFLIETHSEHLILRVMKRIRQTFEGKLPEGKPPIIPDDVCILYVEPGENGSTVREMPLNELGELVKGWPGGFFEEALNEMF